MIVNSDRRAIQIELCFGSWKPNEMRPLGLLIALGQQSNDLHW
jgi:hypothetical protein